MSSALRLSIGANIVLAGIVALLLWRDQPAAPSAVVLPAKRAMTRSDAPKVDAPPPPLEPNSVGAKLSPATVAQLEQSGISRELLVNVVVEDLNRRMARQVLDLQRRYAPRPVPDHEMRELTRQDDLERIRELKAAFGEAGYLAWDKEQTLRNLNRARVPGDELPMTPGEAEQAYRLQKEFDENNQQYQQMMEDGVGDQADIGSLQAQAQQTLDRELEKLLGKQRFDELRGNTDPATEVYRTYGDLNPTAGQASAVLQAEGDYRAREADLAKRLRENPANAAQTAAELKALSDAQDATLRQIFGADAYDNIKRQNDPTYQTLQRYAGAWELNDRDVQSVYQALHAFQEQADRTRSAAQLSESAGQPVNWREIEAGIAQARQQTEAGLQSLIGDERLQRLKRNGVLTSR